MRLVILTLSLLAFLISCCKDDSENNSENRIIGKWDWVESNGGITGGKITPESAGVTRKLIFYANKSVHVIHNQDTIEKTQYFFSRERSLLSGNVLDFLTINYHINPSDTSFEYPLRHILVELNDNRLIINEDIYDGFLHIYERIK